MNYIYFLTFVLVLCIADINVARFLWLQLKRLNLGIEKFLFRLRLEFDIFLIRYNKRKYLNMAREILAERDDASDLL